jgi:hypothetical protein
MGRDGDRFGCGYCGARLVRRPLDRRVARGSCGCGAATSDAGMDAGLRERGGALSEDASTRAVWTQ